MFRGTVFRDAREPAHAIAIKLGDHDFERIVVGADPPGKRTFGSSERRAAGLSLGSMSARARRDASRWDPLFRVSGIAGILFVLFGAAALVLYSVAAPPVSGGEATLRFVADHKGSYVAQQILWLVPSLFGLVVFVALLVALFAASPSLSVLGFTVGAASWTALLAVPVTSEGTLSLVYLSDQYRATADSVARSSFVAAAEALIAQNNTVSLAGALTPLGILLISLPMLRGPFAGWAGWLGIGTGALGLFAEALRFSAPVLYTGYGPLLWLWFAVVGVSLLRLPRRDRPRP